MQKYFATLIIAATCSSHSYKCLLHKILTFKHNSKKMKTLISRIQRIKIRCYKMNRSYASEIPYINPLNLIIIRFLA